MNTSSIAASDCRRFAAPRRFGFLRLWRIAVLSVVVLAPAESGPADAEGTVRWAGCEIFREWALELGRLNGRNIETKLTFRLPRPGALPPTEWIEAKTECTLAGCEDAKGRFQLLRWSDGRHGLKSISGRLQVEFKDGRKWEGSFSAKGVPLRSTSICE
jgi:hypothetical protein